MNRRSKLRARRILIAAALILMSFAETGVSLAGTTSVATIRSKVDKISSSMSPCRCTLRATSREADESPMGQVTIKDLHGDPMPISVVNDEMALRLFEEMTVQRKIPFGFPEDGCFARAHEMSLQLDKKGIATGKVFATGSFHIDSEKAARGYVTWVFHVAPFFVVDSGKEQKIWVIDPSMFNEPTRLDKWLLALNAHAKSRLDSVYLTSRYIYHPSDKDRRLHDFDPEDLKKSERILKRYLKTQTKREQKATLDL